MKEMYQKLEMDINGMLLLTLTGLLTVSVILMPWQWLIACGLSLLCWISGKCN